MPGPWDSDIPRNGQVSFVFCCCHFFFFLVRDICRGQAHLEPTSDVIFHTEPSSHSAYLRAEVAALGQPLQTALGGLVSLSAPWLVPLQGRNWILLLFTSPVLAVSTYWITSIKLTIPQPASILNLFFLASILSIHVSSQFSRPSVMSCNSLPWSDPSLQEPRSSAKLKSLSPIKVH